MIRRGPVEHVRNKQSDEQFPFQIISSKAPEYT